jgi:hypothetical protein
MVQAEWEAYEAKKAMNKTLGLLLIESQMLAFTLAAIAVRT